MIYKNNNHTKKNLFDNAVSIGESKVGITIANIIKHKFTDYDVLLTTSTISSYELLKSINHGIKIVYTPVDISFIINKFLNFWKPSIALFVESEIWPSTFSLLSEKKIKLKILNARMSQKSFSRWNSFIFFSNKLFKKINECYVQDVYSEERYSKLGVNKIYRIPNIKFLTKKPTYNNQDFKNFYSILKKSFVITV